LPGELAARRSALVISNGGSTTGYQALAQGTPVLGIPYNLDQYLAMQGIERAGAGLALRAGSVTVPEVRAAVALLLARSDYRERAREIARALRRYDARQRFADFVATATAS
jgi:UDP:flavonoid glycosyltransferase YjiC (YdhE family)